MRDTTAPVGTTTVVEAVLMGSVLLAGVVFIGWFFLLAGSPIPTSSSAAHRAGWRGRKWADSAGRSDDELAVFLHDLAVDFELAAEAEVADQVGVDGGLVDAARLGIAGLPTAMWTVPPIFSSSRTSRVPRSIA